MFAVWFRGEEVGLEFIGSSVHLFFGLCNYCPPEIISYPYHSHTPYFISLQQQTKQQTVEFEECVGLPIADCQNLIQAQVDANPAIFEGRTSLSYEVQHVRTGQEEGSYNLVGLRTNPEETHVVGVLGDGMVFYPWQWCTADDCYDVGPWDCDVGTPLTVEQCCTYIKSTVPEIDVNGNYLDCFVDPPIGSVSNPIDYGRVCIHVNNEGIVVHVPKNE